MRAMMGLTKVYREREIMQVIGLCRFSYPAIGGFQVEHENIEERIAYLYSDARLEERFRLFEHVTLPGLKAQTDPDFTLLILIGESLPDPAMQRLQSLISDMPQARLVPAPPVRMRRVCQQVFQDARLSPKREPCLQFRHDDDDAVGIDFIANLRQAARDTQGLLTSYPTVAFDWVNGYVAEFTHKGIRAEQVYRPFLGIGFAMYSGPGVEHSIMNFGHHKIVRSMPTLCFGEEPMWVRTHNGFNDSRQARARVTELPVIDKATESLFQDRFGIDSSQIGSAFSP